MRSPLAEADRDRLIEAILPDVPFDGWSMAALRSAAKRCGIDEGEAQALFPRGAPDLVAGFSRWADRKMIERLEAARLDELSTAPRIRLAIHSRFDVLAPWRESVRSSLAVLYAAAVVYWLDDRSEGFRDTTAFVDRRLEDLRRVGDVRARLDEFLARFPDPFRFFRATR